MSSVFFSINDGCFSEDKAFQVIGWLAYNSFSSGLSYEAILENAYNKWGQEAFKYLKGEYIAIVWDENKKLFLCWNSITSYYVLFYSQLNKIVTISNDIQVLLKNNDNSPQLNYLKAQQFLMCDQSSTTETFYKNIQKLPRGHLLSIHQNKTKIIKLYSHYLSSTSEYSLGSGSYPEKLHEELRSAIETRISIFDRNSIGSELSGGLDSTSVAAIASNILKEDMAELQTFSMCTSDKDFFPQRPRWRQNEKCLIYDMKKKNNNISLNFIGEDDFKHDIATISEYCSNFSDGPTLNPLNMVWLHEIYRQASEKGVELMLNGHLGNATISWEGVETKNLAWLRFCYRKLRSACNHLESRNNKNFSLMSDIAYNEYQRYKGHPFKYGNPQCNLIATLFDSQSDASAIQQALQYKYNIRLFDPTITPGVLELCLNTPNNLYRNKTQDRMLIRSTMESSLPNSIRLNNIRGEQNPMWFYQLRDIAPYYIYMIDSFKKHDHISHLLKLDEMKLQLGSLLKTDPFKHTASYSISTYKYKLARALHLAHWVWLSF